MKAFRLTEYEWYAADTAEEAVSAAMKDTGLPRDEATDEQYFTGEPEDDATEIWADETMTTKTTVGAILAEMTEAGFCFGIES